MSQLSEDTPWRIDAHGDRCLVIRFGEGIDVAVGKRCAAAAAALRDAGIRAVSDIVPTFNTVAVHYLPARFAANTSWRNLEAEIERVLNAADLDAAAHASNVVDIPVCYGGEYGPDLADVAQQLGISTDDVIALHTRELQHVFMLGFAPGAPFTGVLDARFALPRRATPRTVIPAGSVGVANRQTFIYPNASPGGWNIIGRTPLVMFDPLRQPATTVAPGDSVRFVPITEHDFTNWPQA